MEGKVVKKNANEDSNEFVSNYCQVLKITDSKGNTKEMYFPKSLDLERPKRSRTNFTLKQLKELEKSFAKNQYLVGKERKTLSKRLELSEAQIKIWYQNRRTKHKKEQYRQRERMAAKAESIAATNIMQLLERQQSQQYSNPIESVVDNKTCLPSPKTNQKITYSELNPIEATNSNPFVLSNTHWNETNYLSPLYFSSVLLHK